MTIVSRTPSLPAFGRFLLFLWLTINSSCSALAAIHVLVDQVGYEPTAPKIAVVMAAGGDVAPRKFALINAETGQSVLEGNIESLGEVRAWSGRVFYRADFSSWRQSGRYAVQIHLKDGDIQSCPFLIQADVLERQTLSNVI
jgi:hypothetical protein